MNHTRFPKEDHLPDWARRDNKDTKGGRVYVSTRRTEATDIQPQDNTDASIVSVVRSTVNINSEKGKAVPLQAWSAPEGSRKLSFLDFVTTAQDGGRLSALRTGRLWIFKFLKLLSLIFLGGLNLYPTLTKQNHSAGCDICL